MKFQITRVRHASEEGAPESINLSMWAPTEGSDDAPAGQTLVRQDRLTLDEAKALAKDLQIALSTTIPVTWEEA